MVAGKAGDSGWGDFELTGRIAAVTACCRGIGRAAALRLARAGADLAVCCRHAEHLDDLRETVEEMGRRCLTVGAHMGRKEEIQRFFDRVLETYGRLDILVSCLGVNPMMAPLVELPEDVWDKILNANLKSHFLAAQISARSMMKTGGGVIITLSSVGGFRPSPVTGAYAISKAGLNMLTQCLAMELAKYNIRVNAICPGLVKTRFSRALWDNPERAKEDAIPGIRMLGEPEDIAGLALYLASDASRFLTGECIPIKGARNP